MLSRVISLKGLYLIGEYNSAAIRADPRATIQYETMRQNHTMRSIDTCSTESPYSLTISLLNTRSLKKHAIDIDADEILKECDILFLTETQIEETDDTTKITDILSDFHVIHNISSDKFCSIAYCYRGTIDYIEDKSIPAVTLVKIKKNSFCPNAINILLLYRKNNLKLDDFVYMINHFYRRTTFK